MEPFKFSKTSDNFSKLENVKGQGKFFRLNSSELLLRNKLKLDKIRKNDESYYANRKKILNKNELKLYELRNKFRSQLINTNNSNEIMNHVIKKFKISDSQNKTNADNRKSSIENIKLESNSKRNSEIHEKFYQDEIQTKNYTQNKLKIKEQITSNRSNSKGNDEIKENFLSFLKKIQHEKKPKQESIKQSAISNLNLSRFKIIQNNQNVKTIKRPETESKHKIIEQSSQNNKIPLRYVLSKNFFQTETNPPQIKEKSDSNFYKNILIKNRNSINYNLDINFNFNSNNLFNLYKIPKIKSELKDIYKLDRSFLENLYIAKSKKTLPLKIYQDNLLNLFSERLSRYSIDKLNVRFKKIRAVSNSVKPTNSTNWNEIEKVLEKSKCRKNQIEGIVENMKNKKEKKNTNIHSNSYNTLSINNIVKI